MLRSALIATAVLASALPWAAQTAEQTHAFACDSSAYKVRIAGTLSGSLQADGNTILVSRMLGLPTFNGAPAVDGAGPVCGRCAQTSRLMAPGALREPHAMTV